MLGELPRLKEGTLVRVPVIYEDVNLGPTGEPRDTSYGIILGETSYRGNIGDQHGYKVWVFDTRSSAVYDEYWIKPLT